MNLFWTSNNVMRIFFCGFTVITAPPRDDLIPKWPTTKLSLTPVSLFPTLIPVFKISVKVQIMHNFTVAYSKGTFRFWWKLTPMTLLYLIVCHYGGTWHKNALNSPLAILWQPQKFSHSRKWQKFNSHSLVVSGPTEVWCKVSISCFCSLQFSMSKHTEDMIPLVV